MTPVAGARIVYGSGIRVTALEREACEKESLDISRKVGQAAET